MKGESFIKILLADDDKDDCFLFQEALNELPIPTQLKVLHDGEQLMDYLIKETAQLPAVLFLDLNMPRKNGFACLEEINQSEKLRSLPVIIFSTSYDEKIAHLLYKNGAYYFIRKPTDFLNLKKFIAQALILVTENQRKHGRNMQPPIEKFLLSVLRTI